MSAIASQGWVKDLLKKCLKQQYVSINKSIDGVLYADSYPLILTKNITVYVDYDNGSDITGDGSSTKPFQTWDYVNTLLPKNMGGNSISLYIKGTNFVTNKTHLIFKGFNNGFFQLYPQNTPTFYRISISNCKCFYILSNCNFTLTAETTQWIAPLTIYDGSVVSISAPAITITCVNNYYRSGIYVHMGGMCIIQSECTLTTNNCTYALRCYCGDMHLRGIWKGTGNYAKAAAWNGVITYANIGNYAACNGVTETFSGGQVRTTNVW